MTIRLFASLATAVAVALLSPPVLGQPGTLTRTYEPPADPAAVVGQLNAPFARIPEADRAELDLFPAIAAMDARPGVVTDSQDAALSLFPGRPGWEEASKWAAAPKQQAVIEAIRKVGEAGSRKVLAMPYGASAPEDYRAAQLWVDLGEPAVLSGAKFGYLTRIAEDVDPLVQVEVTRLAFDGKARDAADLLVSWMRVGRKLADRDFLKEKFVGMALMIGSIERLRDVVYTHKASFTEQDMIDLIGALDDDKVALGRIRLPEGDRLAALQLAALIIEPRGRTRADTFGPTMARLASGDQPLQLFNQAAWWQRVAENHADWFDVQERLKAIFEDWHFRWGQPQHEKIHQQPTDFRKADPARMAIFLETVPDMEVLRFLRLALTTELTGTRLALAVVGYELRNKTLPAVATAVRGRYVKKLDFDPLDPTLDTPFRYFVPIRDQPNDPRKGPQPHMVRVRPGELLAMIVAQTKIGPKIMLDEKEGTFPTQKDVVESGIEAMADEAASKPTLEQLKGPKGPLSTMKQIAAEKITRENITQKVDELTKIAEAADLDSTGAGAKLKSFVVDFYAALFADSQFATVLEKVRLGADPTEAELRTALSAMIRASATVTANLGRDTRQGVSAQAFDVSLDDKQFVIYSVGANGNPEWARSVGMNGDDLLLWPPLLSLMRDNAYPRK